MTLKPLGELLNVDILQSMADTLYRAVGMPVGIIDALSGDVLVGAGWQDICTKFHRVNPVSRARCGENEKFIAQHLDGGNPCTCQCANGLWDIGIPVVVKGSHLATVFLGQFFYQDERPDREFFTKQAEELGFDRDAYLDALDRVPVFSRETVDLVLEYNRVFARFLADTAARTLERMKAEEALRASEKEYRGILENIQDVFYRSDMEGTLVMASPTWHRLLGYDSPDECLGKNIADHFYAHPGDREKLLKRLMDRGSVENYEVELRRRDGSTVTVSTNSHLYCDEEGNIAGVEGIFRDITVLKKIEQALRDSESRFRRFLTNIPIACFIIGPDRRVVYWNDAMAELSGIAPGQVIGTREHWRAFYASERPCMADLIADGNYAAIGELYRGKFHESDLIEGAYTATDFFPDLGEHGRWLTFTAAAVRDITGSLMGVIETLEDVTERKIAEEALALERDQLLSIFDSIEAIVYVSDPHTYEVLYVNSFYRRIVKKDPTGGKCYREFQGLDEPCPFCTNDIIMAQKPAPHRWEFHNRAMSRYVDIVDRIIRWPDGRDVRLEIALDISERKKAEEALAKAHERALDVIEMLPEPTFIIDTEKKIVAWNHAAETLTGTKKEEMIGRGGYAYAVPFYGEPRPILIDLLDEPESEIAAQYSYVRREGETICGETFVPELRVGEGAYLWGIAAPLYDREGVRFGSIEVIRDITDQKRAEEALRTTHLLVDNSPVVLFRWKAAEGWPVEFVSRNVDQFGYTPWDMLSGGVSYARIIHPDDRERVVREVREYAEKLVDRFRQEYRVITGDGRVRWVDDRTMIVRDESGRAVRYEGVLMDITERKSAEELLAIRVRYEEGLSACSQALLAGEENSLDRALRALLEAADAGRVYLFENFNDPRDGTCARQVHETCSEGVTPQMDNPALQHMPYQKGFGRWARELSANRPIVGLVENFPHEERGLLESQDILSVLILPVWVSGAWHGFIGFDDTRERRAWREQDIQLLQTAAGIIGNYIERRKVDEQIRKVQNIEAVGRLAAGIAHDFNNMLTPIMGFSDLLLDGLTPLDRRYDMIKEIRNAAEQSRGMVRQLLSLSRQQVLELRALDLREVVAGMEGLLRRTLREDITVKIVPSSAPCPVKADTQQLEQVVLNLAINAQDAMPGGGSLLIETAETDLDESYCAAHPDTAPGHYIMLAVSDTGHGIDEATRAHVFEPFFTTKEKGKGTGLGLATVYGIVKQHGGGIWLYSEPGCGTTFKIYLPFHEGSVAAPVETPRRAPAVRGGETVMVVEDNPMVRNLAAMLLREQGYTAIAASNGIECMALLDGVRGPVDLLLTDVVMPDMNGKELYGKVAEKRPGIRVLYMSGYTDDVIAHHGLLEEGINFIQKPFSVQGLAAKVREALDRKD